MLLRAERLPKVSLKGSSASPEAEVGPQLPGNVDRDAAGRSREQQPLSISDGGDEYDDVAGLAHGDSGNDSGDGGDAAWHGRGPRLEVGHGARSQAGAQIETRVFEHARRVSPRRRALHLFSGAKGRVDGLAAKLVSAGWEVDEMDAGLESHAGPSEPGDDLLDDSVFLGVLSNAHAGRWQALVAGVPCSTFSKARWRPGGPPVVRRRPHEVRGLAQPPAGHEMEAARANELAGRACMVAAAVQGAGGVYVIENPVDYGDAELTRALRVRCTPAHASLWQLEELEALQHTTGGRKVHFPQCAVGAGTQKWTTLLYSPAADALADLGKMRCGHAKAEHRQSTVGRDSDGRWRTAALAAYPEQLNGIIAAAIDRGVPGAVDLGSEPAALQRGSACVWLPREEAESTEGTPGIVEEVHTECGEPYFTVRLSDGAVKNTVLSRLRGVPVVGSKRPHAAVAQEAQEVSEPHAAASMSLRNNEPELAVVPEGELLPTVNVPPATEWFEISEEAAVPKPLTTRQLIPAGALSRVIAHGRAVQACFARAERGEHGWRVARDMRPEPLVLAEDEAMLPAGRGWSWERRADGLWHPLTASHWPEDPPESDLNVDAILAAAKADVGRFGPGDADFPDQYILACMAHGYPAPELPRATVLGYPHVGALKSMAGLHKCLEKDRRQEGAEGAQPWTVHGGALPHVWPMRADPINVVWRNGKPRITIDKSMSLSEVFAAYNAAVELEKYDPVEMVRVQQLCRAAAILITAGVGVRLWSFDLEAYFRKTGKQRADWWKSGYVLPDGFGFDKRVQFGQKEAPVLTSRQSNFLVWAMRRELYAFDQAHPPVDPKLLAWLVLRLTLLPTPSAGGARAPGGYDDPRAALQFVMEYVDDVGAVSVDDLIYAVDGAPFYMRNDAQLDRMVPCTASCIGAEHGRRPDAHYHIAVTVIERFGHSSAAGKGVRPALAMDLLGVHVDVSAYKRELTELKCRTYEAAISDLLSAPSGAGGVRIVQYAAFNSVVHKLLHAASCCVLGRQHLHHCMAARRAENRLRGKQVLLHAAQQAELRWWLDQLRVPSRHCLPLASRLVFPDTAAAGLVIGYSDAARELASPHLSGFGAWTIMGDAFFYVAGLFEPWELRAFSINVLELAAENMGTFSFIAQARRMGVEVTHSLDFVDNTAAEFSADRGTAHAPGMQELVRRRFDALDDLGVYSAVERITSVDNEWADALSRGEERVQDVLRMVRALGLVARRLEPAPAWRDLRGLPQLDT